MLDLLNGDAIELLVDLRVTHTETGRAELQSNRWTHFRLIAVVAVLIHIERLRCQLRGIGGQRVCSCFCDPKRNTARQTHHVLVVHHPLITSVHHRARHVEHGGLAFHCVQGSLQGSQFLQAWGARCIGRQLIERLVDRDHGVVVETTEYGVERRQLRILIGAQVAGDLVLSQRQGAIAREVAGITQQLLVRILQRSTGIHPGSARSRLQLGIRTHQGLNVTHHPVTARAAAHAAITRTHLLVPLTQGLMSSHIGRVLENSIQRIRIGAVVHQNVVKRRQIAFPATCVAALQRHLVGQHLRCHVAVGVLLTQVAVDHFIGSIQLVLVHPTRHRVHVLTFTRVGVDGRTTRQQTQLSLTCNSVERIILRQRNLKCPLTSLVQQIQAVVNVLTHAHEHIVPTALLWHKGGALIHQRVGHHTLVRKHPTIRALQLHATRNGLTIHALRNIARSGIVVHLGDPDKLVLTASFLGQGHIQITQGQAQCLTGPLRRRGDLIVRKAAQRTGIAIERLVRQQRQVSQAETERLLEHCALRKAQALCLGAKLIEKILLIGKHIRQTVGGFAVEIGVVVDVVH